MKQMREIHSLKSSLLTAIGYSKSALVTRPTKKACIFHLKNCKSMNRAKEVHTQMLRNGFEQDRDTVSKLMVFVTDLILGDLPYAEKVFDSVEDPCLLVYNVMLKAYVKNDRFGKAVALFGKLRAEGWWPDYYTYPFVLKAVGKLGEVREGLKIHGLAAKTWLGFDVYVCNSLMDMYAGLGQVEVAREVFDEMSDRDLVSWNVLISGYVRCRRFQEAVFVFRRMRREVDVKPDEPTVVSTLSACLALNDLELGKEIHDYIKREMQVTTRIGNALVDMYAKCGCVSTSKEIFDSMRLKNVICWTSMVTAYVNCGQLDEAKVLFDRSPERDLILWTAMINGYVQFNRFSEALDLFREMQVKRVKPDKFTLVTLLTGCAHLGALEQGQWLHGYINEHGIPMDVVVSTALIEMYAKCGCIEKSVSIFDGIRENKDTASWTSIICGLAANGKTTQALHYFSRMTQTGAKPDDVTFIGVLSACSHGGLVEQGRQYFALMKNKYDIEPKAEHYGCLIDLLGRAGQLDKAEELIKTIPDENNSLIAPVYGALLSACRIHGNVELGEQLAERLAHIESNDSGIQSLVANMYASANRWEDAVKVRKRMKAEGVVKVPGCSSIEVDGVIHEFLVGDCSHMEFVEVKYMLDQMINPLLSVVEGQQTVICS
ncbi:unnamed protein product [Rhodiola kirilowii]